MMTGAEPFGFLISKFDAPEWMTGIIWRTIKSKVKDEPDLYAPSNCSANASTIFARDPRWEGVIAYNDFGEVVTLRKPAPWHEDDRGKGEQTGEWQEEDTTRAQNWLQRAYGISLSSNVVYEVVRGVARRSPFHPIRDYLLALVWDGKPRCDTWLHDVFGATDTPTNRAFAAKWLISGVARIMSPGCKVDTCLVLEGAQGAKKSTSLRALVGDENFLELHGDLSDKDTAQMLRSKWLGEVAEFASVRRSALEQVKRFFSCPADEYRPSYGRKTQRFPRQIIFAGTTNATGSGYLGDATGARRFWPVECTTANPRLVLAMRDQLWAEAVVRYRSGERWWLTAAEEVGAREAQEERYQGDAWEPLLATLLRHRTPVSIGDCLAHLDIPKERWTDADQQRVGRCLAHLGWVRRRDAKVDTTGIRPWRYYPPVPVQTDLGQTQDKNMPNGSNGMSHVPGEMLVPVHRNGIGTVDILSRINEPGGTTPDVGRIPSQVVDSSFDAEGDALPWYERDT